MSQMFYGSVCVTDILEKANQGHYSFTKGKNSKVYANVTIWVNDQKDQFGNDGSISLAHQKDDPSPVNYIGNFKKSEPTTKPLDGTENLKLDTKKIA